MLAECGEPIDFQFLVESQDSKVAVLLDFQKHGELWEDVYDAIVTEGLEDEPGIPWEEFTRCCSIQKNVN
ncbi:MULTISPECIES: hypothetical protein [unclassified Microcoleus]|uniref:hypothetical protein n=1 Tax=unclassified Microcoleus TaxID=2642155 RepID=UPI002FCFE199